MSSVSIQPSFGSYTRSFFLTVSRPALESAYTFGIQCFGTLQNPSAIIQVVAADMDGRPVWDVNLKGALAVILGGESKGVSPTLRNKSDRIISVPLQNNLDSLNVSVTAGIIFFEKCRQESL